MSHRTKAAAAPAVQSIQQQRSSVRAVCHTLFCTLVLVVAIAQSASADKLASAEDALVLYVGREIPEDGGDIIETVKEVVSRGVLGETTLRDWRLDTQSLMLFHEKYPNLSCLATWRGYFERAHTMTTLRHRREQPVQPFFSEMGGYRLAREDLSQCPVDQTAHPVLREQESTTVLTFEISDIHEPDWKNVELNIHDTLVGIAPREGEPYAINVLICPRVLQIRTPVRAALRMRPHTEELARLIEKASRGKMDLRQGRRLRIENVVQGVPSVSFSGGTVDFDTERDPIHNVFDIYFDRTSDDETDESDSGSPTPDAEACLCRVTSEWPPSASVALRVDESRRFIWPGLGSYGIPPVGKDSPIGQFLGELVGPEFWDEVGADRASAKEPTAEEPMTSAEVPVDSDANPAPNAGEAPIEVAATGEEALQTDMDPPTDADGTATGVEAMDAPLLETGMDSAGGAEGAPMEVAAKGCIAPVTVADDFEPWYVIEGYEDTNPGRDPDLRITK